MTTSHGLVGLMLVFAGCAREAAVAAPVAAPVRECPAYLSPGAMADCRAGYVECGDGPQTGVCAPTNEEHCMGVAERAYELAAGHVMTGLGDAPVPDAAYEDAYAACVDGVEIERHTIPAGSTYPLWELVEAVGCGQPTSSKRLPDGGTEYVFRCEVLTGEAKAERDLEAVR